MIHGITHVCLQLSKSNGEYTPLTAGGMAFHSEPQTVVVA